MNVRYRRRGKFAVPRQYGNRRRNHADLCSVSGFDGQPRSVAVHCGHPAARTQCGWLPHLDLAKGGKLLQRVCPSY